MRALTTQQSLGPPQANSPSGGKRIPQSSPQTSGVRLWTGPPPVSISSTPGGQAFKPWSLPPTHTLCSQACPYGLEGLCD